MPEKTEAFDRQHTTAEPADSLESAGSGNGSAPAASVPAATDLCGKVVGGDFRIVRKLGSGGMGQVFLAEQVSLHRSVALKFLKPQLAENKTSLARFKQEAMAVARTSHANIVQIYTVGEEHG